MSVRSSRFRGSNPMHIELPPPSDTSVASIHSHSALNVSINSEAVASSVPTDPSHPTNLTPAVSSEAVNPVDDDATSESGSSESDQEDHRRHYRRMCIAFVIILLISIVGGSILSYFFTGIYFLYLGFLKGGKHECSQTTGFQVWMYCLVNVIMLFPNLLNVRKTLTAQNQNLVILSMGINFCIEFAFAMYGIKVLYDPGPCHRFRREAYHLWAWAQVTFSLKVIDCIAILTFAIILAKWKGARHFFRALRDRQEETDDEQQEAHASIPEAQVEVQAVSDEEIGIEIMNEAEPVIASHPVFRPVSLLTQASIVEEDAEAQTGNNHNGYSRSRSDEQPLLSPPSYNMPDF